MSKRPADLVLLAGKPMALVTIDRVKMWLADRLPFICKYDLVGFTSDGKPRYRCIYMMGETGEPFVLVSTRVGEQGADVRLFNIWPGIFKHHHEFGDGRALSFDGDFCIQSVNPEIFEVNSRNS